MSRNLVDFDLEVSETRPAALELKFEKHRKKKKFFEKANRHFKDKHRRCVCVRACACLALRLGSPA